jgi:hypothetical protein
MRTRSKRTLDRAWSSRVAKYLGLTGKSMTITARISMINKFMKTKIINIRIEL